MEEKGNYILGIAGSIAGILLFMALGFGLNPTAQAHGRDTEARLEMEREIVYPAQLQAEQQAAAWEVYAKAIPGMAVSVAFGVAAVVIVLAVALAASILAVRWAVEYRPVQLMHRTRPSLVRVGRAYFVIDPASGRQTMLGMVEHASLEQSQAVEVVLKAEGMPRLEFWKATGRVLEAQK